MIQITAIHMEGGNGHEHIGQVKWTNTNTGAKGETSRAGMVDYVRQNPNQTFVHNGTTLVPVGVVEVTPPYIRTYADGVWNDNLLALPRY
jgi:hypothetical protein